MTLGVGGIWLRPFSCNKIVGRIPADSLKNLLKFLVSQKLLCNFSGYLWDEARYLIIYLFRSFTTIFINETMAVIIPLVCASIVFGNVVNV